MGQVDALYPRGYQVEAVSRLLELQDRSSQRTVAKEAAQENNTES